jgi:PB1 domain
MNAMSTEDAAPEAEGGPMWGRFFDSIGHDDGESALSGSHRPSDLRSLPSFNDVNHLQQSPHSEVHPNDSASVMDDDPVSVLDGYPRQKGIAVPSVAELPPADDGTYVFKFRTPSGRTHRFQARHDDVEHLREIIAGKLATDPFFTEFKLTEETDHHPDPTDFHLSYTDGDGDSVLITSDDDVTDAVKIARLAQSDRVVLHVQGGKGWVEAPTLYDEIPVPVPQDVKAVEKTEAVVPDTPAHTPPPSHSAAPIQDEIFGIPKDLLLPASIGALAVVIIGVFTISRLTSSNY